LQRRYIVYTNPKIPVFRRGKKADGEAAAQSDASADASVVVADADAPAPDTAGPSTLR
jgi:hypothetical protein